MVTKAKTRVCEEFGKTLSDSLEAIQANHHATQEMKAVLNSHGM